MTIVKKKRSTFIYKNMTFIIDTLFINKKECSLLRIETLSDKKDINTL